jgi:hypothetical protein
VKYVVVGVAYPALGNGSGVTYGYLGPGTDLPRPFPPASSALGARWRSVVRATDGSEVVATVGPDDLAPGNGFPWGMAAVTETSVSLYQTYGADTLLSVLDVHSHEGDGIYVWINPAAAVITDYAGNKKVSWSWTSACSYPGGCDGPFVFTIAAARFDGTAGPPPNPYLQAVLSAFDDHDRATILAYDPFFDPPGRDPATIPDDPRFLHAGSASVSPSSDVTPAVTWMPCTGTLMDAGFQPMAKSEVPFGSGETLVLEHTVLSTSATCALQSPGLYLATSTPGCAMSAEVYVDTMFGTLLMLPTEIGASCTR